MVAHAGSIQILSSSSSQLAATNGGSDSLTQPTFAPGYTDAYSSYFSGSSSAVGTSENSVDFDGTTLTGYSQVASNASAAKNGTAFANSTSSHEVTFKLTAKSNVSYGLNANASTSLVQKKTGAATATSSSTATLYFLGNSGWETVKTVSNIDSYSENVVWGQGTYKLEVTSTADSTVSGGSANAALATSYSYGYGAYSITATAVPEPTSMAVLACGAVALLRRRKKA